MSNEDSPDHRKSGLLDDGLRGRRTFEDSPDHRKSDLLDDGQRTGTYKATTKGKYNKHAKARSDNCNVYPDVILIGFEKCGSITLLSYLGTHPEISMTSLTVIQYFDPGVSKNITTFNERTPCTPKRKLKLAKLSVFGSAKRVYEAIPNIKLLAIVREPVERVMSHYVHHVAVGKEKTNTFDGRIKNLMDNRTNENEKIETTDLFRQSAYIDRLHQWLQVFGRDRIHVVDGDNFVKHPATELIIVEKFLNISSYFTDDHFVYNSKKKFYCLKKSGCMGRDKGRSHPEMTEITRKRLQAYFKPLNEELFLALGRKFPWNY